MCGGGRVEVCVGSAILPIILLETNLSDYLKRIVVKLCLGYLKDFTVPLCIIHEIRRHTYKVHIHTEPKTMQIICKL